MRGKGWVLEVYGRERKLGALRRSLGDEGYVRGDEATFFCKSPRGCDGRHHKRKLQVNLKADIFHCWVCDWKGRDLLPILRLGGESHPDYVDYKAEHRPDSPLPPKEYEAVRLPGEFRPLCVPRSSPYHRQAIAYLAARGLTSDDILTYKLGYCETGRYAERVIVPSFDEYGELNFFTGRAIWKRVGLPYLNGKFDKDIIFNDLLVDWSRPITLVEGPFDAIKAGINAIPLQGKFVMPRLLDKIIARRVPVRVALDSDAVHDTLRVAEQLLKYGVDVSIVEIPPARKDPGAMSREEFGSCHVRPVSGMVDLVRYKAAHSSTLGAW